MLMQTGDAGGGPAQHKGCLHTPTLRGPICSAFHSPSSPLLAKPAATENGFCFDQKQDCDDERLFVCLQNMAELLHSSMK